MTDPPIPTIVALSGSLRHRSYNGIILETLREQLQGLAKFQIHSLREIPLYNEDADGPSAPSAVASLRAAIGAADALVIASPEYNHGMSGVLKNALDWASRPHGDGALIGKRALAITSSPGALGGVRAHAQINETLLATSCRSMRRPQIVIPFVHEKIRDNRLADEATLAFIMASVQQLLVDVIEASGSHTVRTRSPFSTTTRIASGPRIAEPR